MLKMYFLFFAPLLYVPGTCALEQLIKKLSQQLQALDTIIVDAQKMDTEISALEEQLEQIHKEQEDVEREIIEVRKNLPSADILKFANQDNEWIKQLNKYNTQLEKLRIQYRDTDNEFRRLKHIRAPAQKRGKISAE